MSGITADDKKRKVSVKLVQLEDVPVELRTSTLNTAIHAIRKTHSFLGSMLQCMDIIYSHALPTAGVGFDADGKKWIMLINPHFFCKRLKGSEPQAVLLHEMYHLTNRHPMRVPFLKIDEQRRRIMNIAMDMAINQFIDHLPYGCPECINLPLDQACPSMERMENEGIESFCPGKTIRVEDYKDIDKSGKEIPWKTNMTAEYYYEKLITRLEENNNSDGEGNGPGSGRGIPKEWDQHQWDSTADENDMLDATEELVKRTMQKTNTSYSQLPGHLKELLDEIDSRRSELNYRQIILSAFKRSASAQDRKYTWTRKNRRLGNLVPGTKLGDLPVLWFFIDTSGSISIEEANEFLGICDEFLRVGARKCMVCLFHTSVYYQKPYKLGERFQRSDFQSGGTDLTDCMKIIANSKPNLSVFLTDGYYGDVDAESMIPSNQKFPQTLFIISKTGTKDHPLVRLGETIQIPEDMHSTSED